MATQVVHQSTKFNSLPIFSGSLVYHSGQESSVIKSYLIVWVIVQSESICVKKTSVGQLPIGVHHFLALMSNRDTIMTQRSINTLRCIDFIAFSIYLLDVSNDHQLQRGLGKLELHMMAWVMIEEIDKWHHHGLR